MHPAARASIYGTIELIRKGLEQIELTLTLDQRGVDDRRLRDKGPPLPQSDDQQICTADEDAALAKALEKAWEADRVTPTEETK